METITNLCNGMSEICQYILDYRNDVNLEEYFMSRYNISNEEAQGVIEHMETLYNILQFNYFKK